jgi:hypothetical protein
MRSPVLFTLATAALVLLSACHSTQQSNPPYQHPPVSLYRPIEQTPAKPNRPLSGPQQIARPTETWAPRSGTISNRWSTIVIHHSATARGGAATFDKHHRSKGWDELGYHFVIGNGTDTADGAIEVGSRWHSQKHGAHCKTPNQYFNERGIGICLVGDFTKHPPSPRQMDSLTRLIQYLSHAARIPPGRIVTHGMVNPKTQCPGHHFSLASLNQRLGVTASTTGRR